MFSHQTHISSSAFRIPDIIPIFPLTNVVFFPNTYLPLHVFEPRCRDMVADATAHGQCIGVALLKDGWEEAYEGNPKIFDIGCVGKLISVNTFQDGRSNILLEGLQRCHLGEQFLETSYRQAKISLKPLTASPQSIETPIRSSLIQIAETYLRTQKADDICQLIATQTFTDETLVNNLSAGLNFTTLEKQFLLESEHLSQQACRLIDLIQFKLLACTTENEAK